MEYGKRLKQLREAKEFSIYRLSKDSDISQGHISDLENGVTLDAVNVTVDTAIGELLVLTGEKASDAVINEIFSRFCVGK